MTDDRFDNIENEAGNFDIKEAGIIYDLIDAIRAERQKVAKLQNTMSLIIQQSAEHGQDILTIINKMATLASEALSIE